MAGLVLLPACGGDDAPAGASNDANQPADNGGTNPTNEEEADAVSGGSGLTGCDLLTAAEVEEVVGNPITGSASFGGGCSYDVENIADVNASFTTIDVGGGDATLICESATAALTDYEELSGLGEAAYVESNAANIEFEPGKLLANAGVVACTNNLIVSLGLNGHRTEDELRQMAIELVGIVLSRA